MILVCRGAGDDIQILASCYNRDGAEAAARLLDDPADFCWFTIEPPYYADDEALAEDVVKWHEQQPGYEAERVRASLYAKGINDV